MLHLMLALKLLMSVSLAPVSKYCLEFAKYKTRNENIRNSSRIADVFFSMIKIPRSTKATEYCLKNF